MMNVHVVQKQAARRGPGTYSTQVQNETLGIASLYYVLDVHFQVTVIMQPSKFGPVNIDIKTITLYNFIKQ